MNYGEKNTHRTEKALRGKQTKIFKKIGVTLWKVILACIVFVGAIAICAGLGIWKGIIDSAPDISQIDVIPTGYSTTVLSRDGQEITTLVASGANRKYVTIDEIPQDLKDAVVAIEDRRFYEHNGIDIQGIVRASVSGISNGFKFRQGASTITQQLIKNNVLTSWTSEQSEIERFQRKFQEQYLALELEKQVDNKDWILENYLNTINLGANTLGVQSAAEKYFGKDVSELTLSESTVIAGITKNPYSYNPITHPDKNAERRVEVLDAMLEEEYITPAEYDEAIADNVYSRIAEYHNTLEGSSINSYFVDALIDDVYNDLIEQLGYTETEAYKAIYQGGLTINSTQDLAIQAICDEEANNPDNYPSDPKYSFALSFQVKLADGNYKTYTNQTMLSYYKWLTGNEDYSINFNSEEECYEAIHQYEQDVLAEGDVFIEESESIYITLQPQVALTLVNQNTGEVLALVGGRGDKEANRTWNRATDTLRQPGSTFKILACYAPALDAGGKTLASVQDDAPFTVGTKTYRNVDGRFRGYTNVRAAITDSINIVTLKTLQDIGVNLGYDYLQDFGFSTLVEEDKNLGMALGGLTNGVNNLELTAAYASIANGGEYIEPSFYTTVYDHDGNLLLHNSNKEHHIVLQETTAWLLTNAMQDVLTNGSGTKAYFESDIAQAGKTGTTTDNRDALFAGYTPYYTCAIWGGNDDNSKQPGSGTSYPRYIWREIMRRIHEELPAKNFDMPPGITMEEVCMKSGDLPLPVACSNDPRGSMIYTEYFAQGTQPTDTCSHHTLLNLCTSSGLPTTPACPTENITTAVYLTGGQAGTEDSQYMMPADFLHQFCTEHSGTP